MLFIAIYAFFRILGIFGVIFRSLRIFVAFFAARGTVLKALLGVFCFNKVSLPLFLLQP
jgi:hypothetical protein